MPANPKETPETKTDSLENILEQFIATANRLVIRMEESNEEFKDEIRADTRELKAEMKTFKDEIRADTKELKADIRKMNKKWGELSNKMGTMVEDIVAPNIPTIIGKYFGDSDLSFFGIRIKTLRDEERGTNREFDVIAVSKKNFYVVEVKSNPKPEDVKKFIEMLPDLGKYFPAANR